MPQEILPSVANTQNQAIVSSVASALSDESSSEGLDFLSMMIQVLDKKEPILPDLSSLNLEENLEDISDIELNKASFLQILQLLESIQGKGNVKSLPKLHDKLDLLLQDEKILSEFKGAKNIKDLVKLSKKYDLGLEHITISSKGLEKLQKSFPLLDKKGFFKETKQLISSENILKAKKPKEEVQTTLASLLHESKKPKEQKGKKEVDLSDILNMKKTPKEQKNIQISTPTSQSLEDEKILKTMQNKQIQGSNETKKVDESVVFEEEPNKIETQSHSTKEVAKPDSLKIKSTNIKQTLNTFAQDFKEKVESYKPPVMKVQMALNPKNLGEMDVVIVNRGNNLHVNITSNTSAMNLFIQNQAEFKNALVNMGFTNLEMNFSDQRQNEQQQEQNKNSHSHEDEEFDEISPEEKILELKLPYYV